MLGATQAAMLGGNTSPGGGAGASYLSEVAVPTYAYSVRKVVKGYSGYCLKIRNTRTNVQTDIGFVGDYINESAITAAIGSDTGTVVAWYDQSGNGYTLTTGDISWEPDIVQSGTLLKNTNGQVIIKFKGDTDWLNYPWDITPLTNVSLFNVIKYGISGWCTGLGMPSPGYKYMRNLSNSSDGYLYFGSYGQDHKYALTQGTGHIASGFCQNGRTVTAYKNSELESYTFDADFNAVSKAVYIGLGPVRNGTECGAFEISELVAFASEQTANASAIIDNQMTSFGIS